MSLGPSPWPRPTTALLQAAGQQTEALSSSVAPACPRTSPVALLIPFQMLLEGTVHKMLLASCNLMPVHQPLPAPSPPRPALSSATLPTSPWPPCLLTPAPASLCPPLLVSAPELPVPFHLLSDCFSLAPRCTFSMIPDPSAASYGMFPLLHHHSRRWPRNHRLHTTGLPSQSHTHSPDNLCPLPGLGGAGKLFT